MNKQRWIIQIIKGNYYLTNKNVLQKDPHIEGFKWSFPKLFLLPWQWKAALPSYLHSWCCRTAVSCGRRELCWTRAPASLPARGAERSAAESQGPLAHISETRPTLCSADESHLHQALRDPKQQLFGNAHMPQENPAVLLAPSTPLSVTPSLKQTLRIDCDSLPQAKQADWMGGWQTAPCPTQHNNSGGLGSFHTCRTPHSLHENSTATLEGRRRNLKPESSQLAFILFWALSSQINSSCNHRG